MLNHALQTTPATNVPAWFSSVFWKWVARATRCDPPAPVGDAPTGTAGEPGWGKAVPRGSKRCPHFVRRVAGRHRRAAWCYPKTIFQTRA